MTGKMWAHAAGWDGGDVQQGAQPEHGESKNGKRMKTCLPEKTRGGQALGKGQSLVHIHVEILALYDGLIE